MDISMASLKGGVGKTTSAVHLAAYLQQMGQTILIDSDKNESALTWSGHGKLPFQTCSLEGATKAIRNAEHVVIDTQARPTPQDLKGIAEGCDLLILPATPKALDLDALLKTTEMLDSLSARYKVLLTMVPPHRRRPGTNTPEPHLKERQARKLLDSADIPTFDTSIPSYTAFERCPLLGVTVQNYDDKYSKSAWNCYEKVGEEIISHA
ncbi:MAG: ParA family protein [Cyanobacteria bacterium P01_H01_bin.15]